MNAKNAEESSKTNPRMRVYYDGLCPLCSREIAYYLSKEGSGAINWIDITENGFDPVVEGLDPKKVHQFFHVKDELGHLFVGVEAFIEIWKRIPSLRHWRRFAELPGAKPVMKWGYQVFAKIRPFLPRKASQYCANDTCFKAKQK